MQFRRDSPGVKIFYTFALGCVILKDKKKTADRIKFHEMTWGRIEEDEYDT